MSIFLLYRLQRICNDATCFFRYHTVIFVFLNWLSYSVIVTFTVDWFTFFPFQLQVANCYIIRRNEILCGSTFLWCAFSQFGGDILRDPHCESKKDSALNISQGSVTTCLRSGEIFDAQNLLVSLLAKSLENQSIFDEVMTRVWRLVSEWRMVVHALPICRLPCYKWPVLCHPVASMYHL